ncbi:unnamed protein product [Bemisia tabaci]|uniref:Uncharacterized protein n=1 Tax=Bemisia tabaci TaxID=7038 RepID=A0A9P0ABT7_BEMTA|nr:unnamed protein product [Bemisia tabaci]
MCRRRTPFLIPVSSAPNCTHNQPNVTIQTPQTSPSFKLSPPFPLSVNITPDSSQTSSISLSLHGSSPLCNSESSFSNTESHPSSSSNSSEVEEHNIPDIDTPYDVPFTLTGIPAANIVPRPLTDTDILVLRRHPVLPSDTGIFLGSGMKRYVALKPIHDVVGPLKASALPEMHALSGCDTTGYSANNGDLSW